jgi:hypothetical protein
VLVVHEVARGTGEETFIQPERFDHRRMLIKISGITNQWTREAWLFNDKDLLTNISQSARLHSQQELAK